MLKQLEQKLSSIEYHIKHLLPSPIDFTTTTTVGLYPDHSYYYGI